MDFTKIAFTPGKAATSENGKDKPPKTRIEWLQPVVKNLPDGSRKMLVDERVLVSQDLPHPTFLEALQDLRRAVADACMMGLELDALDHDGWEEALSHLTVRSVVLKRIGKEGIPGVTITALRALDWSDSPLVLNTPFQPVELIPTDDLDELLGVLQDEAEAFVSGKRAQAGLFDGMREVVNRPDSGIDKVTMNHEGREAVIAERAQA